MPRRATLLERLQQNPTILGNSVAQPLPEGRFIGIVGMSLEHNEWDLGGAIRILSVNSRPDSHEIIRALSDPRTAAVVARYGNLVGHELCVGPKIATGDEATSFGLQFLSLVRVRTLSELLIPAVLPCSWSAEMLNRIPPHSCDATVVEDVPNASVFDEQRTVTHEDLGWVLANLSTFQQLYATQPTYTLAVDSLCQHNHQINDRMAAAMLWSGIEALFGIKGEITFRLAVYVSGFLESPGPGRLQLYKLTKSEYNTRSRIVHGDTTDDGTIGLHIVNTRSLLSRLLCKVTENTGMASHEQLDSLVLVGASEDNNHKTRSPA